MDTGALEGDLSDRYKGHVRRAVPPPDHELTATGHDTPCGEYLRSAWQPICLSEQLRDVPLALRILGEDLVAFRDRSGRLGVLHLHCAHRGASLEYAVVMECGISCCYHGWHYDVDGTVLATPGEPAHSTIRLGVRQGAYPAIEIDGIVFAFFGDPVRVPPPPHLDVQDEPGVRRRPFALEIPCNWLQVYENSQDPVHVVFLHARIAGAHFDESNGALQELDFRTTPLGMMNVQTRRWGGMVWTRTVECILPNLNQTGAIWENAAAEKTFQRVALTRWVVPRDDTASLQIGWRHLSPALDPQGRDRPDEIGLGRIDFEGQDAGRSYDERQRRPGDYDAQVSQRAIAVHALEHLASSDRGVAMLRRIIRRGIRAMPDGTRPAVVAQRSCDTFCQDTITAVPERDEGDRDLLRAHGAAVADAVIASAGLPPDQRRTAIASGIAAMLHRKGMPTP